MRVKFFVKGAPIEPTFYAIDLEENVLRYDFDWEFFKGEIPLNKVKVFINGEWKEYNKIFN